MKKVLSLFLVVLMLVGMLPMSALNVAAAAGEYIVAVGSTYFGSAGDADSLVQQVSGNLQ